MNRTYQSILFLLITIIPLLQTKPVEALPKAIAFVRKASGDAEYLKLKSSHWETLRRGARLNSGDRIRTGDGSLVAIVFTDDKSMMKIRSYSDVTIKAKRSPRTFSKRIFAQFGELWFKITSGNNRFALETPTGIAAVKGTEFYALVDKEGATTIIGIEGLVELITQAGRALLKGGNTGKFASGETPEIKKSEPDEVPDWGEETAGDKTLEMEFQDDKGNKKKLKIKFK